MSYSATLLVPSVYSNIQDAIDAANPGDEVLVDDGTYQENILIEKDIILRSVNGADHTTIDGSLGRGLGSTVVIRPESLNPHKPIVEIDGFSIINGKGTNIINKTITLPDGTHPIQRLGGGLLVYVNTPKVNNSKFLNNGDNSVDKGGAIFAVSDSEDGDFPVRDYQDSNQLTPASGELDFSSNTFLNNKANIGNSIYVQDSNMLTTNLSNNYYDVYNSNEDLVTEYWLKGNKTIFNISNGSGLEETIYGDIYVNPDPSFGSDENTGLSWSSPFLTIDRALSLIYNDSTTNHTIYLSAGTFSPSENGEIFPINIFSNITISGIGIEK